MIYALLIILVFLYLSILTSKNILSPATIVCGLWLFCISAYNIHQHNLYPLKDQFYTGISIWIASFAFFSLFTQSLSFKTTNNFEPNLNVRNLYFYITLLTFPFSVYHIYSLINELGLSSNLFINLRNLAVGNIKGMDEGTSNNYFATFWLVAYAIELLHYERKRLFQFIILLFVNLCWASIVMSKTMFLYIFVSTLVILLFKRIIKPKVIYISLGAIFVFFILLQLIRTPDNFKKDNELKYDFFSLYVLTGMPAFEQVRPNSSHYFGENTLRFFYAVGKPIGLTEKKAINPILDFIYVDKYKTTATNVYTNIYPYFKDFGYNGIMIFGIMIGIFYGYVYKKALMLNYPLTITFSIIVTGLITEFMNENTFTTLSFLIQVMLISHFPYWMNKKIIINKNAD